jgi:hypothetical protein
MGFKPSKHKNALMKIVKEKELILQKEAASLFNMKHPSNLQTAVDQLTNEGRIKRVKVKNRMPNGNLNDSWLLYLPNIDYNKVLDYERELINKPFESPLKKHHCYKKDKTEQLEITITEPSNNHGEVIDMSDYVNVNNQDLSIKEFNGQRVVTFKDIDTVHQRPSGTARKRFNEHKDRFILGIDYFVLNTDEAKKYKIKAPNGLVLVTETGYMMTVKTFNDDLSWQVQRQLVNTYFKMQQLATQNENTPIPVNTIQPLDILEIMIQEMKKQNDRVDQLENKFDKIVKILSN